MKLFKLVAFVWGFFKIVLRGAVLRLAKSCQLLFAAEFPCTLARHSTWYAAAAFDKVATHGPPCETHERIELYPATLHAPVMVGLGLSCLGQCLQATRQRNQQLQAVSRGCVGVLLSSKR